MAPPQSVLTVICGVSTSGVNWTGNVLRPISPIIPGVNIGMRHDPTLYFEYEELAEKIKKDDEEIIILIKAFLRVL